MNQFKVDESWRSNASESCMHISLATVHMQVGKTYRKIVDKLDKPWFVLLYKRVQRNHVWFLLGNNKQLFQSTFTRFAGCDSYSGAWEILLTPLFVIVKLKSLFEMRLIYSELHIYLEWELGCWKWSQKWRKLTSSASPSLLFLSARSTQIDVQCQSLSIVFLCFDVVLKNTVVLRNW